MNYYIINNPSIFLDGALKCTAGLLKLIKLFIKMPILFKLFLIFAIGNISKYPIISFIMALKTSLNALIKRCKPKGENHFSYCLFLDGDKFWFDTYREACLGLIQLIERDELKYHSLLRLNIPECDMIFRYTSAIINSLDMKAFDMSPTEDMRYRIADALRSKVMNYAIGLEEK